MRTLTTDLDDLDRRPYFMWDEDVSIRELKAILREPADPRHERMFGKMLREARDIDVWKFVTPTEVGAVLDRVERRLGRRRDFWRFLINGWRADGLLR